MLEVHAGLSSMARARLGRLLKPDELDRLGPGWNGRQQKVRAIRRRVVEGSPTHAGTKGQPKSHRAQDSSGSGCECYPSYVDSGHSKWPDLGRIAVGRARQNPICRQSDSFL